MQTASRKPLPAAIYTVPENSILKLHLLLALPPSRFRSLGGRRMSPLRAGSNRLPTRLGQEILNVDAAGKRREDREESIGERQRCSDHRDGVSRGPPFLFAVSMKVFYSLPMTAP